MTEAIAPAQGRDDRRPPRRRTVRERTVGLWLRVFYWTARKLPIIPRLMRPIVRYGVPVVSNKVRRNTRLNARRIFGQSSVSYQREVVGSFYDFVIEVAQSAGRTAEQLRERVVAVEGEEAFREIRKQGRGCVMLTAHMGSFEVGLAALRTVEPKIRVVFKRDAFGSFERMRQSLRDQLGVVETPIDDGWPALIKLRDALDRNEVVVMQGDRAMPGQKSQPVHVLGGTLKIPVGPVTLARINNSPIVPVYTVREGPGKFRVWLEPAIDPSATDAVEQIGRSVEQFVRRYPSQWLVLNAAFAEDEERGIT
jgi:lauroyl/myristoyl acyltransferase